ncbi:MAG TPA: hypothetical protein VFT10_01540, partial [Solirubrobacterales bacterium]|nr:hypothetical protein [Solirubrobacterales bacterium]
MDYDLSRLNSRSFEQLVQALSTKVIAPGMVSFGDGPDGGRDAGYVGAVPYPSQAEPWDGVIVVQAKFRQRTQGTKVDTAWALEQLQSELETSFDPESTRVKPTHYIFATNVALSSVPKVGGKDQLSTLARSRFPLDGFQIWDHDQICTYLDAHEDVRRAFLGYICPGDVLADVAKHVGEEAPDFDEIIINFVAKELLSDQYAKLEQAGRVADEEIPIARVFVDLPVLPTPAHPASPIELTEEILSIAGERLGPHSRPPTEAFAEYTEHSDGHRGRLVLVGGPGQGKTTAGQFVCQLFRTSLLQSRDPASIAPEARSVMDSMAAQCEEDDIPLPSVRRFP